MSSSSKVCVWGGGGLSPPGSAVPDTSFYGYITNIQDQLPRGLIARSVEHRTGIAEVMGSNPVQA